MIFFKKSGETVHPIALNLFKNLFAFLLFIPTFILLKRELFYPASYQEYGLLLLSGILGIAISDTLFFKSLNILGAGLSAVVDCLYSPFIIGLSLLFLGDRLTVLEVIGVTMILSAVLTASRLKNVGGLSRRQLIWGISLGALAMATTAVGIVIIKPLLNRSPLLWVLEVRLLGGILGLLPVLWFHPQRKGILSTLQHQRSWTYTLAGSFLGTYISLLLWLAGMKYTQTSIAAALNQTSNIFVFIFAGIFLKEIIDWKRILAISLGIAGSFMVFFG